MTAGLRDLRAGTDLMMGWKHYKMDNPLVQSTIRAVSQIHEHIQLCCHTDPTVQRAFLDEPILSCHITLRVAISVSRSAIDSQEDVARSDTAPLPLAGPSLLSFALGNSGFQIPSVTQCADF
jgi:hypothetical protein